MSAHPRKLGKFSVSSSLVESWRDLLPLMAQVVVVDSQANWARDCIEYTAFSDLFEEIPPEIMVPDYEIIMSRTEDKDGKQAVTFSARRINAGDYTLPTKPWPRRD